MAFIESPLIKSFSTFSEVSQYLITSFALSILMPLSVISLFLALPEQEDNERAPQKDAIQ